MSASQFSPSKRSKVPHFEVMNILARVAELKAEGHPVISLGAGEPSGGPPAGVMDEAARIYTKGGPINYTPSLGIQPLREAIAGHYKRWYDLDIDYTDVAVTTGSSGAFVATFLAAFDVGGRVAMARPGYAAYRNVLRALGCEVVELDAGADHGFLPTIEQLEAEAAKGPLAGVVIASPNNPTGTMLNAEQMNRLAQWCEDNTVRLISDEIYHGIVYNDEVGKGACAWSASRNAVVISSFSKYWGMPGWRLGWMLLPEGLHDAVSALSGSVSLCPPSPGQMAAVKAFEEEAYEECDAEVEQFARTRALVLGAEEQLGFTDAAPADGAFYYYAKPPADMLERFGTATAYAKALLEGAYVALTPGLDFDPVEGDQYIRISFAAGYENLAEAIERINNFHTELRS